MASLRIHPEVADALRGGRPVVALESAVITSGLPRKAVGELNIDAPEWRHDRPVNLEAALLMHRAVGEAGAVPAMVAVLNGELCVGLDEDEIERIAGDERAGKASIANLATQMASQTTAGTTVSATLHACGVASDAAAGRIRVFATGGIGGVHPREAQQPHDISADLIQLTRSPVLTVCSGAKFILDVPATIEALETLGVPVVGWRTTRFPQFYCEGCDKPALARSAAHAGEVAAICHIHWEILRLPGSVLLANPIPAEYALDIGELAALSAQAEQNATQRGITGSSRTPFLLAEVAQLSGNRTLRANIALLESNARLASDMASALTPDR